MATVSAVEKTETEKERLVTYYLRCGHTLTRRFWKRKRNSTGDARNAALCESVTCLACGEHLKGWDVNG